MIGRRDPEVEAAVAILRQAGRRVGKRRHSLAWTVGLASYDRRQLIEAADRAKPEAARIIAAELIEARIHLAPAGVGA